MYFTILSTFLTIVFGVIGFFGLGNGGIPAMIITFYVLLVITAIFFVLEIRKKRKKYYD